MLDVVSGVAGMVKLKMGETQRGPASAINRPRLDQIGSVSATPDRTFMFPSLTDTWLNVSRNAAPETIFGGAQSQ